MRRLTLRRLRIRLGVFGAMAVGFMGVLAAVEQIVPIAQGPTGWVAVAGLLGAVSVASLVRWVRPARELSQDEWQPALLLRVLAGALSFQAGLLGYFLRGDVTAAVIGFLSFLMVLVTAVRLAPTLEFEVTDA